MLQPSFGDLAQRMQLQRLGTGLRSNMTRLLHEVTTSQVADKGTALRGDHARLISIDSALSTARARQLAAREANLHLGTMQTTLDRIGEPLVDLANTVFTASQARDTASLTQAARATREAFHDTVAALNTQVAGRTLFAGVETDGPAVTDAAAILDELATLAATAADPDAMIDLVRDWFAPGGGYDAMGYVGGAPPGAPVTLNAGVAISFDVTARDPAFRQILAGLALGALSLGETPPLDTDGKVSLTQEAGKALLTGNGALIRVAESLGRGEARVDSARSASEAEVSSLKIARATLLDADPHAAAARLDELMAQLDTLYTVTARSARLSLTEYLR